MQASLWPSPAVGRVQGDTFAGGICALLLGSWGRAEPSARVCFFSVAFSLNTPCVQGAYSEPLPLCAGGEVGRGGRYGELENLPEGPGLCSSGDFSQHQNTSPDFYQFCKESQKSIIL